MATEQLAKWGNSGSWTDMGLGPASTRFGVVEMEPQASRVLGKCSTKEELHCPFRAVLRV